MDICELAARGGHLEVLKWSQEDDDDFWNDHWDDFEYLIKESGIDKNFSKLKFNNNCN
jgi:hypothetical protein